jgi:hypothetical protein
MASKITCLNNQRKNRRRQAAFTLVELVIASGVGSLVVLVLASLSLFSSQHFAFLAEQLTLQSRSLQMSDQFSKDAREARRVLVANPHLLTLDHGAKGTVTYAYLPPLKTVVRQAGLGTARTLLTDVEAVNFSGYQRTPKKGEFQPYAIASTNEIKVVYCSWRCAKTRAGSTAKSVRESQTAKAVLRTQ